MLLRVILVGIYLIEYIIQLIKIYFINKQRLKPLPIEVSDIYDKERYQKFLDYKRDCQKSILLRDFINLILVCFLFLSDFYLWIEAIVGSNIYFIILYTFMILTILNCILEYPFKRYHTFVIQKKYELSNISIQDFHKDYIRETILNTLMMIIVYCFVGFIGQNINNWTHNFQNNLYTITIILDLCIILFFVFMTILSLWNLRKEYHFTDMPDCPIRQDIEKILSGCKKKIHRITVYDESRKSVDKNAFLMKIFFYREISVADNFMNENAHNELLAVLSHEVGHLRHKKTILNIINYLLMICFVLLLNYMIIHPQFIILCNDFIKQSFHLQYTNYVLTLEIMIFIISKCLNIYSLFTHYLSRQEEYEADRYAVELGYGEELIQTFKKLSHDELIDVNPAPFIETLDYDHPGMYNRIKTIHEEMKKI